MDSFNFMFKQNILYDENSLLVLHQLNIHIIEKKKIVWYCELIEMKLKCFKPLGESLEG